MVAGEGGGNRRAAPPMNGDREPRDSQPTDEPGWWQASDFKWYPPEATPGWTTTASPPDSVAAEPVWIDVRPAAATALVWWKRRWVLVTAALFGALLVVGAISGGSSSKKTAKVV